MDEQTKSDLKADIEKMKEMPWDYTHVMGCHCGGEVMIFEVNHPDGGMYCASIECEGCGKEVLNSKTEAADVIWNREVAN